jgi:hypothetical protein
MNVPKPPTIYPSTFLYTATVTNLVSTEMSVYSPPTTGISVVNRNYIDNHIIDNTYPRSVQYNSDPSGSLQGSSNFIYNEDTNTIELNGDISMTSLTSKISGLADPINPLDAANKQYVDSVAGGGGTPQGPNQSLQYNSSGAFAGSIDLLWDQSTTTMTIGIIEILGSVGTIKNLVDPVDANDAANKQYVDSKTGSAPGLPFNSVQFNSGGIFTGTSDFTWDSSSLNIAVSTDSTSTTTGALILAGGAGISKDVYIGGSCHADEYLTTSDKLLKSDIHGISDDISKLLKVNGYSYKLKECTETKYGLMAQELEEIGLGDFVKNVGDHKKVNYQFFIPVMIETIKSLENRLTKSEMKYAMLENRIKRIEKNI